MASFFLMEGDPGARKGQVIPAFGKMTSRYDFGVFDQTDKSDTIGMDVPIDRQSGETPFALVDR